MPAVVAPAMVGRRIEIGRLEACLDDALAGEGRIVAVSGEAGVGKSRLVAELAARARSRGVRVLVGRAGHAGASTPFRPFVEAFQSAIKAVDLRHPSLELHRVLLEGLLGLRSTDAIEGGTPGLAAMEAFLRLLRVTAEGGVVLVLEDMHWADPETLETVAYIADKVAVDRILCVVTDRDDPDSASGDLITALAARRAIEHIELRSFARSEVEDFVRVALDVEFPPSDLLDALDRRAAGNPFLLEELLGAYVDAGGTGTPVEERQLGAPIAERIPASYRDVVRARLERLAPHARVVTDAAAVIGHNFDPRLLGPITGLSDAEVSAGLKAVIRSDVLTTAGDHFVGAYGFRHVLERESILAELLVAERVELSQRAARAIEALHPSLPDQWCERAANLYEQGGSPMDAARLLQESARRALARSALRTAESALLHARDLLVSDWMMWMAIDGLLLDVYARMGRTEGLIEQGNRLISVYLERYGRHNPERRLAEIHLKIARGLLSGPDRRPALEHLEAARTAIRHDADPALAVEVAALSARAATAAGRLTDAERYADEAVRASDGGSPRDVCDALDASAITALRRGDLAGARVSFTRVLAVAETPKLAVWKVQALLGIGTIDVLETGDDSHLASARLLALELGALASYAAIELQMAWAQLGRPDLAAARVHLDRSWELISLHRFGFMDDAIAARCMLLALSREPAQLQAFKAEHATSDPSLSARARGDGDAVLALVEGQDALALEHLDVAAGSGGSDHSEWWVGLKAFLATALEPNREGETSQPAAPIITPMDKGYAAYAQAIELGRRGHAQAAESAVAEGDRSMPPGWRRHHARRVVADAALDAGWGDPVAWAGEAIEFFDGARLPGLASSCRATLRRAGAPVRRRGRGESEVPDDLRAIGVTSREMDVLKLVGERLSNNEIAEQLFLSARTVETHVSNLQRKAGTSDRKELIALAQRGRIAKDAAPPH